MLCTRFSQTYVISFKYNRDSQQSYSNIFLNLLSGENTAHDIIVHDEDIEGREDALVMETTIEMATSIDEIFHGACIDSRAQLTVIGIGLANAYYLLYGRHCQKSHSNRLLSGLEKNDTR